jgi:hypothetical protein
MLYQDTLGRLYEVPESQVYGLGYPGYPSQVYGLGYAGYDGIFDTIAKSVGGLVSKALPAVASFIPGGSLIAQALPAVASGLAPSAPPPAPAPVAPPPVAPLVGPIAPAAAPPLVPGVAPPVPGMPGGFPIGPGGFPMPRPWPHGWMRPEIPFTGMGPQRLYLRCSTWPGPSGLVPTIAAQAAQAAAVPATAAASAAAQTATALMRRRPYIRHHRR